MAQTATVLRISILRTDFPRESSVTSGVMCSGGPTLVRKIQIRENMPYRLPTQPSKTSWLKISKVPHQWYPTNKSWSPLAHLDTKVIQTITQLRVAFEMLQSLFTGLTVRIPSRRRKKPVDPLKYSFTTCNANQPHTPHVRNPLI